MALWLMALWFDDIMVEVDGIVVDGVMWFDAIMVGGSMAVGVMAV